MVYFSIQPTARRVSVPLYEYKCLKCGRLTEKIENVKGPHLKKCPHCGGKVEVMISASAIQFKGSGWYVTDYAAKSKGSDGSKDEKPAAETKEATAKESAAKGSEAKESSAKDTKETKEKKSEKTEKAAKKK
jgi:putative FmdB family regulatory protein